MESLHAFGLLVLSKALTLLPHLVVWLVVLLAIGVLCALGMGGRAAWEAWLRRRER